MQVETEAYHYTKDKHGRRTGNTVCVLLREGRIFFGEAICSSEDQFARYKGREVAKRKAQDSYARWLQKALEREKSDSIVTKLVNVVDNCFNAPSKL